MDFKNRKLIVSWLYTGLILSILIVVIGGITRLTNSGLSMVKWELIMDMIPPLDDLQWESKFQEYKKFPEYQKFNQNISISEFKIIYFWEWLHRFLARLIGIIFIIPFLFFWIKNWLNKKLKNQLLILLALGGLQAFLGAYMVESGLEIGEVSHFRLATHLITAFILIAYIYWIILCLGKVKEDCNDDPFINKLSKWLLAFLAIQIIYGAFMAGLNAGSYFDLHNGLIKNIFWYNSREESGLDLLRHPDDIQAFHRLFAWIIFALVVFIWKKAKETQFSKIANIIFFLVTMQIMLGITTLLLQVHMNIALAHQLVAIFLLLSVIKLMYLSKKSFQ